jgi:hypothetical protein
MVSRLVGALAVCLSALALAACGGEETVEHHAGPPHTSAPGGPQAGDAALEQISGTTVYGDPVDVALDGRDVILWFWAPW